jgi:hypothetical protein
MMNIPLLDSAIQEALSLKIRPNTLSIKEAYALVTPLKAWQQTPADQKPAQWEQALKDFQAFLWVALGPDYLNLAIEKWYQHIAILAITHLIEQCDQNALLRFAIIKQNRTIVQFLLSHYAEIEVKLEDFMDALSWRNEEIISILLADPRVKVDSDLLKDFILKSCTIAMPALLLRLKNQTPDLDKLLCASIAGLQDWNMSRTLPPLLKSTQVLELSALLPTLIERKEVNWGLVFSHPSLDLGTLSGAYLFLKASEGDLEATLGLKALAEVGLKPLPEERAEFMILRDRKFRLKFTILPALKRRLIAEFYQTAIFAGADQLDRLKKTLKETGLAPVDLVLPSFNEILGSLKTINTLEEKIVFLMEHEVQLMSSTKYPVLCGLLGKEKDELVQHIHVARIGLDKQRSIPNEPTAAPITPSVSPSSSSPESNTGIYSIVKTNISSIVKNK